jgi:hypothetical protein
VRSSTGVGSFTSVASTARTSYGVLAQVLTGPLSVFTTRTRTRRPGSTVTGTSPSSPLRVRTPE